MLLWLMNMGFAGGTVVVPVPVPPEPIPPQPDRQSGDGFRREEAYRFGVNHEGKLELLLKEDEEILIILSAILRCL